MPHAYQVAYTLVVILTCGVILWAGGRTERTGLMIVIVGSLASYPVTAIIPARWSQEMVGTALVDGMTTVAFFVLMVRSRAYWPIWSFGFCVAMMAAHGIREVQRFVPAWSYYDTTSLWAYPVIAAVVAGAIRRKWRAPIVAS